MAVPLGFRPFPGAGRRLVGGAAGRERRGAPPQEVAGRPAAPPHGGADAVPPEFADRMPPEDRDDTGCVVRRGTIDVAGARWERLLIRTHVIQPGEDIVATVERYVRPYVRPGDWAFIGQKAVSIAQRRLVREQSVHPRPLAEWLSGHVKRTPFGRGLGRPATMEIALREAGVARILLACAVHLAGRPLGRSGDFYRIAGRKVASIDGVTEWALPPFNRYIVLHPRDADEVCRRIARRIGVPAAIVDLNDLGGEVLGASPGVDRRLLARVVADNPLGQGPFRTPLGLARPIGGIPAPGLPEGAGQQGRGHVDVKVVGEASGGGGGVAGA